MPKYFIREIYVLKRYGADESSKDFNITFIVIEKIKILPRQPEK